MDHRQRSRAAVDAGHKRIKRWLKGWEDHIDSVKAVHDEIVPGPKGKPCTTQEALAHGVALTVSWYDAAFGWMFYKE
jgi:hypothetical protein